MARKDPVKEKETENQIVVQSMYKMASEIERIKRDPTAQLEYIVNTTMQSATEYTLAVDEVLHSVFHFSNTQIDEFHEELGSFLRGLGEVHQYGNHPMTPKDMAVVGEIARAKAPYEKNMIMQKKLGIALPTGAGDMTKDLLG